jgi:hypothetical protein
MRKTHTIYGWLAAVILSLALMPAALADTGPIRVQINHAEILHLDADAHVVHIANPAVADVILESPRLLFIVGLAPGQTGIFILDRQGNEIINTDLLVTPSDSYEVSVNRNAVELTYSCSPRCVVTDVPALAAAGTGRAGGSGESAAISSAIAEDLSATEPTQSAPIEGVDGGDVETAN